MTKKESAQVGRYLPWPDNFGGGSLPPPRKPTAQHYIDRWGAERRAMLSANDTDVTRHYSSLIYQGYNEKQRKKD